MMSHNYEGNTYFERGVFIRNGCALQRETGFVVGDHKTATIS